MRAGFGVRHPALAAVLERSEPSATTHAVWADGTMPLQVSAYLGAADVPDELITSIRCIVRVGDLLVLCENEDSVHPWPGGRRNPAETHAETAAREVHEETGWLLDGSDLEFLGWLHLTHLAPQPDDYRFPYPDFLQFVYTATASQRDGGPDVEWSDTEGYEQSSRLVTVEQALARTSTDALVQIFLKVLAA
jgi:ADP-ribose pyrophosphatase YjhB (NUDIX family)